MYQTESLSILKGKWKKINFQILGSWVLRWQTDKDQGMTFHIYMYVHLFIWYFIYGDQVSDTNRGSYGFLFIRTQAAGS